MTKKPMRKAAVRVRDRYLIEAVDRSLQLLEMLADETDLGVTEIAQRMGVSKALAFRLLYTLERRDYVIRDPERRTSALGYRVLHLAEMVEHNSVIVRATKALMDELARVSREDVNLFVRTGLTTLCVAARPSPHPVRMYAEVGRSNLLHAGGSSTVLLAFAPAEVQESLLRGDLKMYTPLTLTDPMRLRQRLDQVRREGYHIARGDVDEAGFSIAAPVYGHGGAVVAAVSIAGALSRLTKEASDHHRDLVIDFAARMTLQLGGTVPIKPGRK
jgi:IclR family transcriptional regulator, KDG regulon repressor